MHGFASLFLVGSYAFQTALGFPSPSRTKREGNVLKRAVDDFIATEEPIALESLIANIGSGGGKASGAADGVVVASPSKSDPNYFYTWTRDAALVFKAIVERFSAEYDADLQTQIQNYIIAQSKVQTINNPSGSLSDGTGLGEAKYNVDLTAFTDAWGRPQRDGPALRAITLSEYSKWLIANGYTDTVTDVVWPIIKNDLAYVSQYWNLTGFDLWEEVQGSSFFTVAAQHRSLVEGSALASTLGEDTTAYDAIAPQVLCFQQSFWDASNGFAIANFANNGRSGKDGNSILASIHNFDPELGCDAATFQPCSDRALSSHKVVVDSFRDIYGINSGIGAGAAVAVGRYSEDTYYNGNPWYLLTAAAAEQLYDALYVWQTTGSLEVTDLSLAFFQDLSADAAVGTYASDSDTYTTLYNAVYAYAEGFVDILSQYTPTDGSLTEQYDKNDGTPLSAADLTWSYASFLTLVARRNGVVPAGWAGADSTATVVPSACAATSVAGSYATATATAFPASQTPVTTSTAADSSTFTRPTATATSTGECSKATSVAVTFRELKTTTWGQTVKIVGNVAALGNWDTSKAVTLSAASYTASQPLWKVSVRVPTGTAIQYKYILVNSDGSIVWEADPNRSYTIASTCATSIVKDIDSWR
ncbi:carbohydrate-binding module family 20 protein [Hypoxylon sp. CI-4A]|nr:carbohydrate-binding module family 20 protein [Hypoxylon sp. CI-4A]